LVVAVGVEGEFAEDLAGLTVDDDDVEVVDQESDGCAGVFGAEADVVEFPASAEADFPAAVDGGFAVRQCPSRLSGAALARAV
jgi:hypothetical protein